MAFWFLIVRLVIVPGRCSSLSMPPFGRLTPVMEVPSKYTYSMFAHPEMSTACVNDGQLRTSSVRSSTLLPRYRAVRLLLEYDRLPSPNFRDCRFTAMENSAYPTIRPDRSPTDASCDAE